MLAVLGAACAPVAPPPATVERVAPSPGGRHLRIEPEQSEVRILVYRTGPLARLGHNHVLVARRVDGEVWLPADAGVARFWVSFAAADLAVDEPLARREEGEEFASEPTAADVEGTRHNLLGPAVLDAARYPVVRLEGEAEPAGTSAQVRLSVRDRTLALDLPVVVEASGDQLAVQGGFTVLQSALGLTPFSAAFGALRVRDDLAVRFRVVAAPAPEPGARPPENPSAPRT